MALARRHAAARPQALASSRNGTIQPGTGDPISPRSERLVMRIPTAAAISHLRRGLVRVLLKPGTGLPARGAHRPRAARCRSRLVVPGTARRDFQGVGVALALDVARTRYRAATILQCWPSWLTWQLARSRGVVLDGSPTWTGRPGYDVLTHCVIALLSHPQRAEAERMAGLGRCKRRLRAPPRRPGEPGRHRPAD